MNKLEKVLLSALVVGVLGSLTTLGVFGAFSVTTSNNGNEFSTGTVTLHDNDSGSALYNAENAKPGDSVTKCIKVTYLGTLTGDVHLFTPDTVGPLAQYENLTITAGTQTNSTFPDCTGFTPVAGEPLYTGTLQTFASTYNSFAADLHSVPSGKTNWDTNDSVVYKFQVTLSESTPSTVQAQTTGEHAFVWEARAI